MKNPRSDHRLTPDELSRWIDEWVPLDRLVPPRNPEPDDSEDHSVEADATIHSTAVQKSNDNSCIDPIVVRKASIRHQVGGGIRYLVLQGMASYEKAAKNGLESVPIIIRDQRFQDIRNPDQTLLSQAHQIRQLMEDDGLSFQAAANFLLVKKSWVQMRLDVLRAGPDIHSLVEERPNSLYAAQRLSYITDDAVRRELISDYKQGIPYSTIAKRIAQWRVSRNNPDGTQELQGQAQWRKIINKVKEVAEVVEGESLPPDYRGVLREKTAEFLMFVEDLKTEAEIRTLAPTSE